MSITLLTWDTCFFCYRMLHFSKRLIKHKRQKKNQKATGSRKCAVFCNTNPWALSRTWVLKQQCLSGHRRPSEAPSGEEAPLATGDRLQGETTWWEASSLRDVLLALHGGTRASLESKGCKFSTPSLWPGADTSEHLWSEGCSDVGSRL